MSKNCQTVPWYNVDEWYEVYNNIYAQSSTLANKQYALDQLLIWKTRCPALPSGIESTLSLLEVHIQDQNQSSENWDDHLLRLAYSSALMRFVNHMLDKETATGLSLYRAAKSLGVPEWIIELRHNVAHSNNLPCLELLREASLLSLEWLQQNYWDKHKLYINDYRVGKILQDGTDVEKKITALMNFCVSLSICSHPKCNVKNVAAIPDIKLKECLVNDCQELLENSLDLSNLKTVSIGRLRNAMKSTAIKLLSNNTVSCYVNKALLSDESLFLSLELYKLLDNFSYSKGKPLSRDYIQCFDVLLGFLFDNNLLQDFILELIRVTQSEDLNNLKKCMLAAKWISIILKALKKNHQFAETMKKSGTEAKNISKDKKDLKALYFHWYPNEKKDSLIFDLHKKVPRVLTDMTFIQPIITKYNPYLTYFISDLLCLVRPPLPLVVINKICQLAKVIAYPEKFSAMSSKIYTGEELEMVNKSSLNKAKISNADEDVEIIQELTTQKNSNVEEIKQIFGIWQVSSTTHEWSKCPIGQVPWVHLQSSEPMET